MAACQTCTRPTDAHLCQSCIGQLATALRSVPWLADELTVTLTRQSREGGRTGGRSAEKPLPFHLGASVDLESLRDGLKAWARSVADHRGVDIDATPDPADLSRWLLRWQGEIAIHPDAAELHGDILALIHAAQRTIDRSPDLRFVGPCDGHQATAWPSHGTCGADLYVGMHAREVVCRTETCKAIYPIEDRRAWLLDQAVDQLRTARQLAYELPWIAGITITSKVIGMWAARDKITRYLPHPQDPDQTARFRVGEVIEVATLMAGEKHKPPVAA